MAWALWCIALTSPAHPYGQKPDAQRVEDALKRVQQWRVHQGDPVERIGDVDLLALAGATQAVPALKEEFTVTKDTWLKLAIASALVKFGDKEPAYWDFLADKAKEATENDAPFIWDSEGKADRNQRELSPEFIEWAKAHNLDPAAAAQSQVYELPIHFGYLAKTGDPRGRELLRMGLKSRNYLIQSFAARGLAKLQDKDSIPLIIEACTKLSQLRASWIARALIFFDDPRAQSAAEMFIDKQMLEELRKLIREHGADPFLY